MQREVAGGAMGGMSGTDDFSPSNRTAMPRKWAGFPKGWEAALREESLAKPFAERTKGKMLLFFGVSSSSGTPDAVNRDRLKLITKEQKT